MIYRTSLRKEEPFGNRTDVTELRWLRERGYSGGLIGQDDSRYGGRSWGNASMRHNNGNDTGLIITPKETGGLPNLCDMDYVAVEMFDASKGTFYCRGLKKPSTDLHIHWQVYDSDPAARFIYHGHSRDIWRSMKRLMIPSTSLDRERESLETMEELKWLFSRGRIRYQIFSVGSDFEGVFTFGDTAQRAWHTMNHYLNESGNKNRRD